MMICGWNMKEILIDTLIDTIKLIPFLFLAFLFLEYLEHKMQSKNTELLINNRKFGPVIGSFLGVFPQCGFSCIATKLFSSRVITLGTLIAVYLSTSDEMIAIMLSSGINIIFVFKILFIKFIIGLIMGFFIDFVYRKKCEQDYKDNIHDMCLHDDCHCEKGIVYSSLMHTLSIISFLFIATFLINRFREGIS